MKKKILCCIGIVLACALLLSFLQLLVVPKYASASREGNLIGEYYAETTPHDVLFVGDCEVYESFTPPTLWEEYGITSYIRGSAQQLTWHSYYLLEEMLREETPKAVVFNVLALKYGVPQSEAYNRMTLDGMRWSTSKIGALRASMREEESFLSYVFPLLRFHSRWKELSWEDFEYLFTRAKISHNGYMMQTGVHPKTSDRVGDALIDYTLPQGSMEYLERMRLLCEEKGIAFILIKAPTNNYKYYWYDEWDAQVREYAEGHQLAYYNFIPLCEEIGIDWSTDTYDGGAHLNVFGAEKLTSYFGAILAGHLGLEGHKEDAALSAIWQEKLDAYYRERNGTES
ncbi:MAG: SGNH/GDSL hydrolase family protein [Clostridia bacterium]|nr:SGNH/GDSL hydrolase family protein [Clostridia bacterium]MBR2926232.1 SGNH/GDSL hydrolase family protein [Clostridia bacterium]